MTITDQQCEYATDLRNRILETPAEVLRSASGLPPFDPSVRIIGLARTASQAADGLRTSVGTIEDLRRRFPDLAAAIQSDGDNSRKAIQQRLIERRTQLGAVTDEEIGAMTKEQARAYITAAELLA